mmetsp:Transcript_1991/g.4920  ORF Transcript_1991/g.4920 Transcript_1991/m.4920 type:complete len:432 (+) Transcript_1991:61-1356(+)
MNVFQRPIRMRGPSIALILMLAAMVQLLLVGSAMILWPSSSHADDGSAGGNTIRPSSVVNDGLVWITPKPPTERRVGYEDDWLMEWKRRHYSPEQRPRCVHSDRTPYDDGVLCTIPAYVPARLHLPAEDEMYPIPRVIFTTWSVRRLGRAMYTSLLTLMHHNPEYEFILFDDEDVDRFVCETSLREDWALPIFSKIRSGAMRSDVWRLLVIRMYGGVYVDSDISSLGKLPVQRGDTMASGVACWSHLPGDTGGAFEHWAMAYAPHHPFAEAAAALMRRNLEDPAYLLRDDTPEAKAEDSWTMRLTGPAMYQRALHDVLEDAGCERVDNSYCDALWNPKEHCLDMGAFRSVFPKGHRLFQDVNFDGSFTHKVFHPGNPWEKETTDFVPINHYDDPENGLRDEADAGFCDAGAFEARANQRKKHWRERLREKD